MNKKAIELSVNFIVMVIIAIVIFGFGLYLAFSLVSSAEKTKSQLDQETILLIENMLDTGEKVVLPFDKKTIKKGQGDVFGYGIRNIKTEGGSSDTFYIEVNFEAALDSGCKESKDPQPIAEEIPQHQSSFELEVEKNEKKADSIPFLVPHKTSPGCYVYNLRVYENASLTNQYQYDFTKQIKIVVP